MRSAFAVSLVLLLALAGCSDNEEPSADAGEQTPSVTESPNESASSPEPSASPTKSPSESSDDDDDDEIEIEIEDDEIKPNGARVEVGVGEMVKLRVESDRAGELHVHSTPEQELSFGKGRSVIEFDIAQPGIVDVEEHESGIVLLQLEVS